MTQTSTSQTGFEAASPGGGKPKGMTVGSLNR